MPSLHALLSPSAAHRWLNCTAAPRLEASQPDSSSIYAREGTLAHAYCARHLKTLLGLSVDGENREIAELDAQYHTGEMDEYTEAYKTIVLEKFNAARAHTSDAQLFVETRLDFSEYIPDGFGTADAIIIADGVLDVIDFKYGKGVIVSAQDNPQMKIYALGAYEAYSLEYNIQKVHMTIVQPRVDNISEWEMDIADLMVWAHSELVPKARAAYSGGEQNPGGWCQFCRVKHLCRALARKCCDAAGNNPDPHLLTTHQIAADILPLLPTIKTWLAGIEDYVLGAALDGEQFPGYKLVAGRSVRRVTDPAAVQSALKTAGFATEAILKPQELRTLTDLEKTVGAKRFAALCGQYVEKPQGKPTLVPESDKRPPYNAAVDDFAGIG